MHRTMKLVTVVSPILLVLGAGTGAAQTPQASTDRPTFTRPDTGKWAPMPDIFPKGAEMQVLNGDPAKGPADF